MKSINKATRQFLIMLLCMTMAFSVTACGKKTHISDAYKLNSDVFGLLHGEKQHIHHDKSHGANGSRSRSQHHPKVRVIPERIGHQ